MLELTNVEMIYNKVIMVLKGVSLSVPEGESWPSSGPTGRARPPL